MTAAADWFEDEATFRQLCGDAQSQARSETAQNFAADMVISSKRDGLRTYLTARQLDYLCKLADWDIPKRRTL
jgi:hypothetical protein